MKRNFEAIKKKFYSPLMDKRTIGSRSCEESNFTKLNEELLKSQTDNQSLESANTPTSRSKSQPPGPTRACTQPLDSAPERGINGSGKSPSPNSPSQLGKRAIVRDLLQKPRRQPKLQRSTYITGTRMNASPTDDVLQPNDDELKRPVALLSSNEELLLEIPLPPNLQDFESSNLSDTSKYQTTLVFTLAGAVREVRLPPDQGIRLSRDLVRKLHTQLVPSKCYNTHGNGTGFSKQITPVILLLLENYKSRNRRDRKSTKEEYMSTEWCRVFSSVLPSRRKSKGCTPISPEQRSTQLLYENQTSEFRGIWSSKRLQMAEVAACMMKTDFQFLSLIQ